MRKKYSEQERQLMILQKLFEAKDEVEKSKNILINQLSSIIEHLAKIWLYPHNADNHKGWLGELSEFSRTMSRISDRCRNRSFIINNLWYGDENQTYSGTEDKDHNKVVDSIFKAAMKNAADMDESSIRKNYKNEINKFKELLNDYINWLSEELSNGYQGLGVSIPDMRDEVYGLLKKYFNDDYYELDREYTLDSGKRRHSSRRNNRKDRKLKKKGLR